MRWLPAVLLVGCMAGAGAGDGDLDDGAEYAAEMSAAEAVRVLALVNYPGADRTVLDDAVGLTPTAATSIATYRAGADGVFPSKDDNEIDGIPELDAIPNIGAAALQKLSTYASAHPAPEPVILGSRRLLGWQAEAILWATNTAPIGVFTGLLDDRAAHNLIAARPLASLAAVDAVALIGPSAFDVFAGQSLTWWRAFAATTPPPPLAGTYDGVAFDEVTAIEALAIANIRTRDAMVANGVAGNGASIIIGNRPYTSLAQVAAISGVGPATMRGLHAFAAQQVSDGFVSGAFSSTADLAIPDGGAAIMQSLEVVGLASVPEHVMIHLDIDHPRPSDLRVTLVQPSSAEIVVWAAGSAGAPLVLAGATLERDSEVNGAWLLAVQDTVSGTAGVVRGWSLAITSRYD